MNMSDLDERYIEYSEALSELVDVESTIHNKRRILIDLSEELSEGDGSYGIEFSAHAFQQISERLEKLASSYPVIHRDVYKEGDCLLSPSNLKSFIITMLANAKKNGSFKEESSKSGNGTEFRYTINMKKWSAAKSLKFVAVVENNNIKSGWFNWV